MKRETNGVVELDAGVFEDVDETHELWSVSGVVERMRWSLWDGRSRGRSSRLWTWMCLGRTCRGPW